MDEGEVSHVVASSSGTAGPTVLGRHEEGRRWSADEDDEMMNALGWCLDSIPEWIS